ncbi:MAG: hypothetical protein IJ124_05135 [Clostridia bacterium]|nr:hypothetical protein [Clostridia bacterium]MBQ8708111.1 hypothetical protein [Succinivibrionaceae bacterium]MBQ8708157.1 hypothetical protein [Succinivibrionaceae bacterium]
MKQHKDGLTSNCPHFKARTGYQGGYWIDCAMGRKGFKSAWEVNQYYKAICCRNGCGCELIDINKGRRPKS